MSEDPVDLSNFKSIIEGDTELGKEMFGMFVLSSEDLLRKLQRGIGEENSNNAWYEASHALKGISRGLGAGHLADLCEDAQEAFAQDNDIKIDFLAKIKVYVEKPITLLL